MQVWVLEKVEIIYNDPSNDRTSEIVKVFDTEIKALDYISQNYPEMNPSSEGNRNEFFSVGGWHRGDVTYMNVYDMEVE